MAAAMIQHQPVASSSRSAPAARVPAFLTKLYAMVEDASVDRLIHWNEAEDGFVGELLLLCLQRSPRADMICSFLSLAVFFRS